MIISYAPLFKQLIDKGLKKTDLLGKCGIGSATLAKFSKGEEVSLGTLIKLCEYLDCSLNDIIELKKSAL